MAASRRVLRLQHCFHFVVLALATTPLFAADATAKLDGLLAPLTGGKVACSAVVLDATTGAKLYGRNSDQALIPASNQKLFVMAAAVETLGPEFEFNTILARSEDDLVVIGSGDPGFGDPKLAMAAPGVDPKPFDAWINRIIELGAQVVPGDIILDESAFDKEWTHPRWKPEELQKWYAAPVGALNINDNCLDITLIPPAAKGGTFSWEAIPATQSVVVELLCKWGKGEPVVNRIGTELRYQVSGRCNQRWRFKAVAVPDPGLLFGDAFKTALARRGIGHLGQIRRTHDAPAFGGRALTPLAVHRTPLSHVLARIGKDSQNMFAEALAKRLGYEWSMGRAAATASGAGASGNPSMETASDAGAGRGSWATARQAVGDYIKRLSSSDHPAIRATNWGTMVWDDASGLSRDNRASADQLAAILAYMQSHAYGELFMTSLSEAGVDGSLSKRSRLKSMAGSLFGKTGTLNGVRSLSGYLDSKSGRRLVFAIILNEQGKPSKKPLTQVTDEFCTVLYDWPAE